MMVMSFTVRDASVLVAQMTQWEQCMKALCTSWDGEVPHAAATTRS